MLFYYTADNTRLQHPHTWPVCLFKRRPQAAKLVPNIPWALSNMQSLYGDSLTGGRICGGGGDKMKETTN